MHMAAGKNSSEVAEILIRFASDVNAKDNVSNCIRLRDYVR